MKNINAMWLKLVVYTTKTCSYCGKQHNMGSKKVMNCSCGAHVDRDLNGARGIYLRALSVTTLTRLKKSTLHLAIRFGLYCLSLLAER
ncbi:MAG: zinc ribbon domain-containing protein [Thiotrichaceae bacterium]